MTQHTHGGAFEGWLARLAAQREQHGLTRRLFASDAASPTGALVDLAGNDYLGLSRHPQVVGAAAAAAREYGAGAGASRLVTGTLSVHERLEQRLAEFTGFEAALVASTGYHANLSAVTALSDADTLIVSDAHVHASLIDACRLARAERVVVPHNDVEAVERALAGRHQPRALVIVESIYSVLGDAAPLTALAAACATRDAVLVVDEAHGIGVAGRGGRGLVRQAGLAGQPHVVVTVTLSKALGSQGGAVLGSPAVREHLINTARPFIYDTGLAPAAAAAATEALDLIEARPELPLRLHHVARALTDACDVEPVPGAVLAVAMGSPQEALEAVSDAAGEGLRIGCFRPPSTPDGISRLRLTAHADLDDVALGRAVEVLEGLLQ